MKKYQVVLSRGFLVSIEAENRRKAARLAEFYLGDCKDCSTKEERDLSKFSIENVEMTLNEALEVVEVDS